MNPKPIRFQFLIPDSHPHLVVEKGKNGKGVGSWVTQQKYQYLCKYIDAARGGARKWPNRIFIDPFCGPGRILERGEAFTRPNGAVTAWLQSQASGVPFSKMMIGDLDFDRVEACTLRLQAQGANVHAFAGPAKETVIKMLDAMPSSALCYAYIDPYNLELIDFEILANLAKLKNIDFIIYFSTMDLFRNVDMELDPDRARFDDVSPGWRQRLAHVSKKNLSPRFFDDWQKNVQGLGFTFSKVSPPITNDEHKGIYNLVFLARHDLPLKLWSDIAKAPQTELF